MLPETWVEAGIQYTAMGVFWATIAGLVAGLAVGKVTKYYGNRHKQLQVLLSN